MNALITHWKLFVVFLFLGLFLSFGLRAASSGADHSAASTDMDHDASKPKPKPKSDSKPTSKAKASATGLLIDIGNKNCPIMDGPVDGKTFGEWKHLRVSYCCAGCDKKFQKDPAGVLDKAGIEWREAARAIEEYLATPSEHKKHKLAAIRKRWNIVREPSGDEQ